MADAVVSSAIENLGKFLVEEAQFLHGVKDQVEEMKNELELMQCFLGDADRRQGESQTVCKLVSQIREATYDVEDVIEHFVLKSTLRSRQELGFRNRIKRYTSFFKHVVELQQVGSRIESIKTRLSNLRARLQSYGIEGLKVGGQEPAGSAGSTTSRRRRQEYAHVIDHNVVGLDQKISEIVAQLLIEEQEQHDDDCVAVARRSGISIYGMGGLGKTTLGKKVYSDSRIRGHFEGFAWVYLSQQFNQRDVWKSILGQLSYNAGEMTDDELASRLCQVQKEKKCLVVIDDIWSIEAWEKLSPAFPYMEAESRSKILVTTRNEEVALHVDRGVYHNSLDTLNHTNSLELLVNTIRFLGGPNHPIKIMSSMEECASEMVKQCGGLPLAIIVLGGILATKHELRDWEKISLNIKQFLNRGSGKECDGVTSVLESSYYDLSYNLKSCFLYLSQYPEDCEIRTTQLMQMWMGEGFVSASVEYWGDGDEIMEDVAEQYLNELVSRCLIQVGKRNCMGKVKTCRMHDLMRDLCISKAREESFMCITNVWVGNATTESEKIKSIDQIHRLCVFCHGGRNDRFHTDPKFLLSLFRKFGPKIRSLLWFDSFSYDGEWEVELIVENLKLSRVLVIEGSNWMTINSLGKSKRNMLHLRHLSLRGSNIGELPSSIKNLMCLETLDLRVNNMQLTIPNLVWMMEQLRHLYLPSDGGECESIKQRVCNMRNLQTLVNFPPKGFDLQQNLAKLTNVRKLVMSWRYGEVEKIRTSEKLVFSRLHSLSLRNSGWFYCEDNSEAHADLEVITASCPNLYKLIVNGHIMTNMLPAAAPESSRYRWPSNLTKLILYNSRLDAKYIESLGKLQSLKILFMYCDAFVGKEMIFHENDFPQLQHLLLQELDDLETWKVHEGAIRSLSRLEIEECSKLKSVPDRFEYLKQLKELQVRRMPDSFRKRVEPGGDDWHKVSHVPSISFF